MPIDKDIVQSTPKTIEEAVKIIQDKYNLDIFEKCKLSSIIIKHLKEIRKIN